MMAEGLPCSAAAIAAGVTTWSSEDRALANQMIRDHLPKVLFDFAGERVWIWRAVDDEGEGCCQTNAT